MGRDGDSAVPGVAEDVTARVTRTPVVLTCRRCGMQWDHLVRGGTTPLDCPDCRRGPRRPAPEASPAQMHLIRSVVEYRLAIELATAALRLGRTRDALQHLEDVAAPLR